ncbi:MAG: phosphatase PAP2 family protein [Parvibaculum sp.]
MNFLHDMDWVLPLRSDSATIVANAFTWLGYSTFFLIALPLTYWLWDRAKASRLVVLIAIAAVLNGWLKDFWQDPRPDIRYSIDPRAADSYGRPSGHAEVAFAMWMWIAYEIKRPWAWGAAIIIVAGVCMSRIYLGVHDLDDVLTGLALGVVGMIFFIWLQSPSLTAIRNLPGVVYLAVIVATGAGLFYVWPNSENPGPIVGLLALLFGWVAGADMDHRLAPDAPQLPHWLVRVAMGVGGIVVLFAFRAALTKGAVALHLSGAPVQYAISAMLGFYMTGLAPLGFRLLKIVK